MAGITRAERERRAADAASMVHIGLPELPALQLAPANTHRTEWLAVAAHGLPAILADMRARKAAAAPVPSVFDAVDAVIAEADRRWPG